MADYPVTTIIVDDEESAIDHMIDLLEDHQNIQIIGKFKDPVTAVEGILDMKPELLFLDIQMPKMSGFDIVKEIRSEDYQPQIIFTTAYEKFAIEAIRHAAMDYLLKPVDETELKSALERLQTADNKTSLDQKLESLFNNLKPDRQIKLNTKTGFVIIAADEILYCEASRNYCEVYLTGKRREIVTMNMNSMIKRLPSDKFFRISRFYTINLKYLRKAERKGHYCILSDGEDQIKLKASRNNLKMLEDFF